MLNLMSMLLKCNCVNYAESNNHVPESNMHVSDMQLIVSIMLNLIILFPERQLILLIVLNSISMFSK